MSLEEILKEAEKRYWELREILKWKLTLFIRDIKYMTLGWKEAKLVLSDWVQSFYERLVYGHRLPMRMRLIAKQKDC
jgi:hypothetical protein